jgi:hypothetical protein
VSFADYWNKLTGRNAGLKNEGKMTISVENFRKALEQAYNKGVEAGQDMKSVFERMFGKTF